MVLIGHSMGGVISRLMVSSSDDDTLWNTLMSGRGIDDRKMQRMRRRIGPMLEFEPVPSVKRAIFIASPHRGTDVAGGRAGRLIRRMVRLPLTLLEGFGDILEDVANTHDDTSHKARERVPNSIDNLDRADPFVRAASDLPISRCVQYHSIIAQVDPAIALSESDDGLVPYWSSHLTGAASEKIIHSAHSVQGTPPAVVEMRRILHEDIQELKSPPDRKPDCGAWNKENAAKRRTEPDKPTSH
jgi:pimeloyl-ACP methyl ester carboxylesterase